MFKLLLVSLCAVLLFADGPAFKTGQTTVYHTGDDGTYQAGTAHSYTRDAATGIVTDAASGLQWQDSNSFRLPGQICWDNPICLTTWESAQDYCTDIDLDGMGWRLPTIEELKSIVDYADTTAPIIASVFQNTASAASDGYWSSTSRESDTSSAWGVGFGDGHEGWIDKSGSLYVRCVRGTPAGPSTYTRNSANETVYDSATGLTWQDDANASSQTKTWSTAIDYCEALIFAGQSDWRLPNYNELYMIADRSRANPAIDPVFQNIALDVYWSSTTDASDPSRAWSVYFENGNSDWDGEDNSYHVRCVRGGQIGTATPQKALAPSVIMYLLQ